MIATEDLQGSGNPGDRTGRIARFGQFELDLRSAELRRAGVRIRLQDQPLRLLAVLLERPGEIVTRDELRERLWKETFVDFDHGLNTAIRKLRTALDDSADNPRFIETLARRGYRFIAPVTWSGEAVGVITAAQPVTSKRRNIWIVIAAAALIAIAVVVARIPRRKSASSAPQDITSLTTLGTVIEAAISPDGKYLAYATADAGKQGLWLKQIATGNLQQLRPPASLTGYWGLTFHPDSSSIDYVIRSPSETRGTLYRMPTIGGAPQRVFENVETAVTFAPEGDRLAFYRRGPQPGETSLVIAQSDGSSSRILHTWRDPQYVTPVFFGSPAWSPDGQWLACGVNDRGGPAWFSLIRARDGGEEMKTASSFSFTGTAAWLSDHDLALVAADPGVGAPGAQLWHLTIPDLKMERITDDILDYRNPTVSADGKTLVAVVSAPNGQVWSVATDGSRPPVKLPNSGRDGLLGLTQTPDGRVVLTSFEGSVSRIVVSKPDGSERRFLTPATEWGFAPAITPDGRTVVFDANINGASKLLRVGIDGDSPAEICTLPTDTRPTISSDGRWIYFTSPEKGRQAVRRVSIDGGRPELIGTTDDTFIGKTRVITNATVSPDGSQVAMLIARPEASGIMITSLRDGSKRLIPLDPPSALAMLSWMPDGSALLISGLSRERANVWLQPLDGSPARPITNFQDFEILRYSCCQNGSMLVQRGTLNRDAVMLKMK